MLKRLKYLAIFALMIISVRALSVGETSEPSEMLFSSPLHLRTLLAGNFGETRPGHLHSGIDIKTNGKEGKAVFAIGDGYISKVVEDDPLIGNALFVHHPEGHTSIYCHLQRFIGIAKGREEKQGGGQVSSGWRGEKIPVAKGQLIAVSGNTGVSEGPHLHLELRDARTNDCLDPLDYVELDYTDKQPPVLHAIKVYPQDTLSHFNGHTSPHIFTPRVPPHPHTPSPPKEDWGNFAAWGKLAFSINAHDYMEGSYNKLGVRDIKCYIDDQLFFEHNIVRFSTADHVLADLTCDQEERRSSNAIFIYTWFPPTHPTSPQPHTKKEIINIDHEKDYHLLYVLTDQQGNESRYTLTIKGQKEYKEAEEKENREKAEKQRHEPKKKTYNRKTYKRKHHHKRKNGKA
ncbi:MAG: M23 family metallopeptidase [Prevotella sp.]|nr:M23 family metallopeptidase [Prevotella sp.]